jgi:hypothetical protein
VAAELLAGWLPGRISGPVVVVADPVVVDATVVVVGTRVVVGPVVGGMLVVVDAMLVVVTRVVVGAAVVGAVVVVDLAVVGGAVAVSWVVVASEDERAVPVVAPPTLAGAGAVAGRPVVGRLMAPCSGPGVVEGGGVVVGSRSPGVVVDAAVGAGLVGEVGSATPGARRGGWGWGIRVAEATRAARIAVVSPKTNSSSLQGRRGLARCRGGGVGMVRRPGSAGSSGS